MCRYYYLAFCLVVCYVNGAIIESSELNATMFTTEITGDFRPAQPTNLGVSFRWPTPIQVYEISCVRANIQLLPQGFNSTPMFVYATSINGTLQPSYPGPAIIALENTPVYVKWSNDIQGPHILPVDTAAPFDMMRQFINQTPTVPHNHGLQAQMGSDGQPMGFWTYSGRTGSDYFSHSSQFKKTNEAIYRYPNTKEGLYWYHDHVMSITRLNVYAGLIGYYQIVDPIVSLEQRNILLSYGDFERKHFVITDKTFNTDGSLFYSDGSYSSLFTTWIPQFFGNTFLVNGKVWPKVNLQAKKYRIVMLNGCQSRFLKISFENNGVPLNFQLFRRDSDYLKRPLQMQNHLLLTGARIQIFLDLTHVTGEVMLRNSAASPFPSGTPPDQYTSQIMKIVIGSANRYTQSFKYLQLIKSKLNLIVNTPLSSPLYNQSKLDFLDQTISNVGQNLGSSNISQSIESALQSNSLATSYLRTARSLVKNAIKLKQKVDQYIQERKSSKIIPKIEKNYPEYSEGTPVFTVLIQLNDADDEVSSAMIDAVGLQKGCQGSTYKTDKTYDFYIINLTMDDHPIHIHLVNFQVVGRFEFNSEGYLTDFLDNNGDPGTHGYHQAPEQLDVRPYKTSNIKDPLEEEKLYTDIIHVPMGHVTIARVRFNNRYGIRYPFSAIGSKYVFHCHILEHQDNEMMRYFCLIRFN